MNTKCVHCLVEMKMGYGNKVIRFPCCEEPQCPNYGLLQAGIKIRK